MKLARICESKALICGVNVERDAEILETGELRLVLEKARY
jgi:hypothetical protein